MLTKHAYRVHLLGELLLLYIVHDWHVCYVKVCLSVETSAPSLQRRDIQCCSSDYYLKTSCETLFGSHAPVIADKFIQHMLIVSNY